MSRADQRAADQAANLKVSEEAAKAVEDRIYAVVETMWNNKLEVNEMVLPIKATDFNILTMSHLQGFILLNGKVRYKTDFGEIYLQVTA